MTGQKNGVGALTQHRAQVSAAKRLHVIEAIEAITADGAAVTVAAVARKANVSREFIYSHDELRNGIELARERAAREVPVASAKGQEKSLRAERETLLSRIARDRATIATMSDQIIDFQKQRQVWLGSQLAALTDTPAQEMRVENDRLNQRVIDLQRELDSITHVVLGLREELRISRIPYAEALRELDARHDNVTYLSPHEG